MSEARSLNASTAPASASLCGLVVGRVADARLYHPPAVVFADVEAGARTDTSQTLPSRPRVVPHMTSRVFLTKVSEDHFRVTKQEPAAPPIRTVEVREAEPDQGLPWPAVWLNAEPAYDVYVMLDGIKTYRVPDRSPAVEACYEQHRLRGGGSALV